MMGSSRLVASAALALVACGAGGCVSLNLGGGGPAPLEETVVDGESGPKILLLDVDGVIQETEQRGAFGMGRRESVVARVREELDKAGDDDDVRALVLRINSPGGTATASEVVYREIRRFKAEKQIPVVAQFMGMATSGAYYIAMAADRIHAHPTSVTGSIGVIFAGVNFSGLMQKLGVEDQTITGGEYKDVGSPLRPMRPEERAQLQGVIDDLHARFRAVVAEGRPALGPERVAELADGRIFSASQALEAGLVDAIGDLEDAIDEAERRAGLSESRVVSYHRPSEWRENVYSLAPRAPALQIDLGSLLGPVPGPAFLYLWWPAGF